MTASRPLLDADYAAIEARIVNWLAGQQDAVAQFAAYDAATTKEEKEDLDPYRLQASLIFNVPVHEVNKFPQRFIGKQAVLLCGFQGGAPKFRQTCEKFGYKDMPEGLEFKAVDSWRKAHANVVDYWQSIEDAAQYAIISPGEVFTVRNVALTVRDVGAGFPFLLIKLPSGRKLAYPKPKLLPNPKFRGRNSIVFFGKITEALWGDVHTYGGKLVENITQAVAADIMANGAHNVEAMGYEIASLIHDQALAYTRSTDDVEGFVRGLTKLPAWAKGLPVAAEGALVPFYKKD